MLLNTALMYSITHIILQITTLIWNAVSLKTQFKFLVSQGETEIMLPN